MDGLTVQHYTKTALERVEAYDALDVSGMHQLMLRSFSCGTRLLEIGCGSGRDAAFLVSQGRDVTATDATEAMVSAAVRAHPELAGRIIHAPFPLPSGHDLLSKTFDGVYAIAVVMHLPDPELDEFAAQVKKLLRPGGTLMLSFSANRSGLKDNRDEDGRLFLERTPEEILQRFEPLGFRLLEQVENGDGMGQQIRWHTLVMALEG